MRKLVLSNMISLDGFFEGPNAELDWHNVDADFIAYATDMLNSADTILFGRVTYQMMASYWSAEHTITNDPIIAGKMNSLKKMVFSRTLDKVGWNNSVLLKGDLVTEVAKLKQQAGKDILVLGSGSLASQLTNAGLIDEYRIIVNPVILGHGKSHFRDVTGRVKLKLINAVPYESGNVMLYYQLIN